MWVSKTTNRGEDVGKSELGMGDYVSDDDVSLFLVLLEPISLPLYGENIGDIEDFVGGGRMGRDSRGREYVVCGAFLPLPDLQR